MSERAGDGYVREAVDPVAALVHPADVLHQRSVCAHQGRLVISQTLLVAAC